MAMKTHEGRRKNGVDLRSNPGWISRSSHGRLIYQTASPEPMPGGLCSRVCKRAQKNHQIFFRIHTSANVYRGELLGLTAIHRLLVSVNRVQNTLVGSGEVVSDCLGALKQVVHLPPYWIPSRWKHTDIVKNILVNC